MNYKIHGKVTITKNVSYEVFACSHKKTDGWRNEQARLDFASSVFGVRVVSTNLRFTEIA